MICTIPFSLNTPATQHITLAKMRKVTVIRDRRKGKPTSKSNLKLNSNSKTQVKGRSCHPNTFT